MECRSVRLDHLRIHFHWIYHSFFCFWHSKKNRDINSALQNNTHKRLLENKNLYENWWRTRYGKRCHDMFHSHNHYWPSFQGEMCDAGIEKFDLHAREGKTILWATKLKAPTHPDLSLCFSSDVWTIEPQFSPLFLILEEGWQFYIPKIYKRSHAFRPPRE